MFIFLFHVVQYPVFLFLFLLRATSRLNLCIKFLREAIFQHKSELRFHQILLILMIFLAGLCIVMQLRLLYERRFL